MDFSFRRPYNTIKHYDPTKPTGKGAIHVKKQRVLAALLALVLMLTAAAFAEAEEDFGFDFDDEGYTGEWMLIDALGLELCLPDGWSRTDPEAGADFAAAKDDGAARLEIRVADQSVEDMVAWGDAHLESYEIDDSGFFDTLVVEEAQAVQIYRLDGDGQVLAYAFTRDSADALSADFALEIVDSVNEAWIDEGDSLEDEADLLAELEALVAADD